LADVGLPFPEQLGDYRRVEGIAKYDPVQVGTMSSPVARVANEGELLAALPALNEEGAVPDRPPRLRVVDPIAPDLLEILAPKRVLWQDDGEEIPPEAEAGAKIHPHRLRPQGADAPDPGLVQFRGVETWICERGPVGEKEVPRAHRHAVAPASLALDVIRERERRLPSDVDV
jgi:hypothetical protein